LGEKKCQRGGRDEEGKGVFRKMGMRIREHGNSIDKPTFLGIRIYIFFSSSTNLPTEGI